MWPAGASTIVAPTEVVAGHERQGLGQVAVRAAVELIAGEGKSVIAVCPFARAVIGSDPELAAPAARRRADAPTRTGEALIERIEALDLGGSGRAASRRP